jgi:transposase-like protein
MSEEKRLFSRDFKLRAVKRMEAGESSSVLSVELSVKRTLLYRWRDAVRRDAARWRKGICQKAGASIEGGDTEADTWRAGSDGTGSGETEDRGSGA